MHTALLEFGAGVLEAHGAPPEAARAVAESLVRASLQGHDSHGILRLGRYVEKIMRGELNPAARPEVVSRSGATAVIDGRSGFGHVAASLAADTVSALAREHGVGAVALRRTTHIGRLGDYAAQISGSGLVALIFTGGAARGGSVAPFGGRERVFGTNPLAWGLPVPAGRGPLVADFSTSVIPEGKVAMAAARGEPLPAGVLVDREGNPATDPSAFYDGGALLSFGGHKGGSLLLLIEVLANILGGSAPVSSVDHQPGNPTLMVAVSPESFVPMEDYHRYVEELLRRIESSAPGPGVKRVALPNTPELETERQRLIVGIPVPAAIWEEFGRLASDAGVTVPESIAPEPR
jgi:LDH2 family malate/lactate/ureidoglycolate dehydrogenase